MIKIFITNGRVAWQVPPGLISICYDRGLFIPPDGWYITDKLFGRWDPGEFGELRKKTGEVGANA